MRDKLQRLSNIRRHKIEDGLKEVSQAATVKLNNLSAYEANMIRLSFQGTLNMFLKLEEVSCNAQQLEHHIQLLGCGRCYLIYSCPAHAHNLWCCALGMVLQLLDNALAACCVVWLRYS